MYCETLNAAFMFSLLLFGQAFYCRIQTLCLLSVLLLLNESMVFVWKSKNLRSTSWFGSLAGRMMKWRAENNNSDPWHRLYLIFLILATLESSKARGVCVCLCLSLCVCAGRDGLWQCAVTQLQQQKLISKALLDYQKTPLDCSCRCFVSHIDLIKKPKKNKT